MASRNKQERILKIMAIVVSPLIAFGMFRRIGGVFKVPPEQMVQRAEVLIKEKHFDEAMAKLQEAKKALPQDSRVWLMEGAILAQRNQPEEALKDYVKAEELDSSNYKVYLEEAVLYGKMKKYKKAEEAFDKVKQLHPDVLAYYNLGLLYLKMGRFKEARVELEQAQEKNPAFPGTYRSLGILDRREGQLYEAKQNFERYLQLFPKAPDAAELRTWIERNAAAFDSQSESDSPPASSALPTQSQAKAQNH